MKFSYNWICELVEGVNTGARELGQLITMKTAECEGVEPFGEHLAHVCAARVLEVTDIPGSHNKKVVVDAGQHGKKTVVCGAPNCREGMITAYAPPGVKLARGEIRRMEVAGVLSDGMLASGAELDINRDAEGVLEFAAEPGDPIPGCAPDSIIEIDNKSITHRPDLWGHHGLAREVAAILGLRLKNPVNTARLPEGAGDVLVSIEDFDLCPRYSALTFDNVTVQPSPLWLQYRLHSIDLHPINNIVDVTNFVMAEITEPMHAFDRDTLKGDTIYARPARAGEFITALNQETYKLEESMVVIADARGPVAIGGVIGGLDTGIVDRTRRIVLEAANFKAASIRKTSTRLKLRTDASMRFEKAQDPTNTVRGLARAVELFEQASPGLRLVGGVADAMRPIPPPPEIALDLQWLARKLGRNVDPKQVLEILERLEFEVREEASKWLVAKVPSWRATRDISIKDDLVEEVGRMIGYDAIPPRPPLIPSTVPPANEERLFHRGVRAAIAAQGFTEVYNYSFVNEEMARRFGMDPAAHVAVTNPIADDQDLLRISLAPRVWKNIQDNSRHFDSFRLFEIGYEIHRKADGLPDEADHLVAAIYERDGDGRAGLFELKRVGECLMPGLEAAPVEARPFEHPARAYQIRWRGETVGRLYEMHPSMGEGRAAMLDVNLQRVRGLGAAPKRYQPLRKFPASAFDLSVVAGVRELAGEVEKKLRALAGESLETIEFVRQYTGPPLAEGTQSLSFRLTVYAPDHTLTAEEVSGIRARIIDGMRASGYDLRV
ncbi:MAG: phenylalanine--tRNA ligase subunit beta [Bryobacteraceae bacterium]|nr:phenylalanine--tRNA ligase subunit beta [Bryobacteraceae bacterium]